MSSFEFHSFLGNKKLAEQNQVEIIFKMTVTNFFQAKIEKNLTSDKCLIQNQKHKLEQLSKIIYSENQDLRTIMVSFRSD